MDFSLSHWCYRCDKRVAVDSHSDVPNVVCLDCKSGFVELISAPPSPSTINNSGRSGGSDPSFNHQFLQILRLFATAADIGRHSPALTRPIEHSSVVAEGGVSSEPEEGGESRGIDDILRIELHDGREDDDFEGDEEEEEWSPEREGRPDVVRVRLRDQSFQISDSRNRNINWAEILRGIEDNSIELRVEFGEQYVGNPEDYVDASGYEALLRNLAANDGDLRKGAPPASRSAVLGLPSVVFSKQGENNLCAICKEGSSASDKGIELPCGHIYHEECIFTWLDSRNSCPVCRFELPTDDPEYEEQRRNATRFENRPFRNGFW